MKFSLLVLLGVVGGVLGAAEFQLLSPADAPGWMVRDGQVVRAELKLDAGQSVAPKIELVDFDGRRQELTADFSGGDTAVVEFTPGRGYFQLVATPQNGIEISRPLAVVPAAPPITPDGRFGINFHLTRVPVPEAQRELALAEFIGFSWARGVLFDWSDVPADYQGMLRSRQGFFEILRQSKLQMLGSFFFVPRWASGAPEGTEYIVWSRIIPDDLAAARQFAKEFAAAVPFVQYWEVGNEPDAELFWRGRWQHSLDGDDAAIMRDYVDFLAAVGAGLKQGNSKAQVLYAGLTGPVGHTYQPFLETTLRQGAAGHYDIMNLHYRSDLSVVREIMRECGAPPVPIWITELGGSSVGRARSERSQIVEDVTQAAMQLAAGADKVFKYDFRNDGIDPLESEHHYGMVRRDFSPKPNYVAAATMIEQLTGRQAERELNIVAASDHGYLRGITFSGIDGAPPVQVIWLVNAPAATVTLETPDAVLTLVDALGRRREVTARDGKVSFAVDELPFYLHGRVTSAPGPAVYPEVQMVKTIQPELKNLDFEKGLSNWHHSFHSSRVTPSADAHSGRGAVCIQLSEPGEEDFKSLSRRFELVPYLAELQPGEFLWIEVSACVRRTGLIGRGSVLSVPFYNAKGERTSYLESPFRPGTHAWRKVTLTGRVPADAVATGVDFYVAPRTTGTFEVDDVTVTLQVMREPGK